MLSQYKTEKDKYHDNSLGVELKKNKFIYKTERDSQT